MLPVPPVMPRPAGHRSRPAAGSAHQRPEKAIPRADRALGQRRRRGGGRSPRRHRKPVRGQKDDQEGARELGMTSTQYQNASGLPDAGQLTNRSPRHGHPGAGADSRGSRASIPISRPRASPMAAASHTLAAQPRRDELRRRRRPEDRLYPRLRLQRRHVGSAQRPPHHRRRHGRAQRLTSATSR